MTVYLGKDRKMSLRLTVATDATVNALTTKIKMWATSCTWITHLQIYLM